MVLGDRQEALMLLGFVFGVMGISFVQQRRSERSLEALRDLSSPRALVERDGKPAHIAARELVVGDIVLLAEGDRVPADVHLLQVSNFAVDESLLTGESMSVDKESAALDHERPALAQDGPREAPAPKARTTRMPTRAPWSPAVRRADASWPPASAAHSAASANRSRGSSSRRRRSSRRRAGSSNAWQSSA